MGSKGGGGQVTSTLLTFSVHKNFVSKWQLIFLINTELSKIFIECSTFCIWKHFIYEFLIMWTSNQYYNLVAISGIHAYCVIVVVVVFSCSNKHVTHAEEVINYFVVKKNILSNLNTTSCQYVHPVYYSCSFGCNMTAFLT